MPCPGQLENSKDEGGQREDRYQEKDNLVTAFHRSVTGICASLSVFTDHPTHRKTVTRFVLAAQSHSGFVVCMLPIPEA